MPIKDPQCPHCLSIYSTFVRWEVLNIDQINEIRRCALCDNEYSYFPVLETPQTEKEVVDQIISDEKLFRECRICHKNAVLPDEWIDICPNCLFWDSLTNA